MRATGSSRAHWPLIAAGAVLSLFGVLLLFDQIDRRNVVQLGQLWPLLFIAMAASVTGGGGRAELRKGLILLAVGVWFLVNTLNVGGLDYGDSWPLLLILIGVAITVTPRAERRLCCDSEGPMLILWGSLAWIATRHVWGMSWGTIWPLALVAIGVAIVWRAIGDQLGGGRNAEGAEDEESDA